MADDKTRRSAHKPEESHKRRGKPQERNADHEEPHVEGLLGHDVARDVHGPLFVDWQQTEQHGLVSSKNESLERTAYRIG